MSDAALDRAVASVRRRAPDAAPVVAIVLGSGLGEAAGRIAARARIPVRDIPGFPIPAVPGHAGELVLGRLGGVEVACLVGRSHAYEGAPWEALARPVRCFKALGCRIVVLGSAVASLAARLRSGRLALVADHINLTGTNPLIGPNDEKLGPRFPDMTGAYDAKLRRHVAAAARRVGVKLGQGVLMYCVGPSFETPAEIRAFKKLGADMVGMSMVPEVVIARHCGLRVAGIAAIVNLAAGLEAEPPSHARTTRMARAMAHDLGRLLEEAMKGLADAV